MPNPPHFSSSAKIGLSVGIALGIVLIWSLGIFCCRTRARHKREAQKPMLLPLNDLSRSQVPLRPSGTIPQQSGITRSAAAEVSNPAPFETEAPPEYTSRCHF